MLFDKFGKDKIKKLIKELFFHLISILQKGKEARMAKRKYSVDEQTIEKRYKEGRGKGHGSQYLPWIYINEVPSKGYSSIRKGWKTGRMHHLLSTLESQYFFTLEWSKDIIDIREQYPLLPREETQEIAQELGIRHPYDRTTKTDIVMTSDFVVTRKKYQSQELMVRAVKYELDMRKKRNKEKLLIEKVYWKRRRVNWAIINEHSINKQLVENIEFVHKSYHLDGYMDAINSQNYLPLKNTLLKLLTENPQQSISRITSFVDEQFGFRLGIAMTFFKHLIATRSISVDMESEINTDLPIPFVINPNGG
ncbi:TnsA endonuclease C-terminal domain-containing protein [Paenibacillus tyrfis]|uniref:TnsA endonuclease C-terminal domain-containing protein n=1 Tax=Paenibacillus tyrfis TaxID=1501230 RepID=UPI00209DFA26|nr:TnsA endonuclease C-terminal domain-containing protein [Paenibacillus tyrfis]MCP1311555.1 TnsA endonuclease N-terminal domain-containing protein [Paenibacillus tyrfis]